MPGDFQQRISTIEAKARLLAERYAAVKAQRDEARAAIADLNTQLEQSRRRVEALKMQVEHLQLATSIEQTAESAEDARKFLSELVWEIDKCITQLSD